MSREIQRNSSEGYYCSKSAEHLKSSRKISADKNLAKLKPKHLRYIFGKLKQTLSPEQIAAIFTSRFKFSISTKSIYLAIYRECHKDEGNSNLLSRLRIRSRIKRKNSSFIEDQYLKDLIYQNAPKALMVAANKVIGNSIYSRDLEEIN